MDQDTALTKNTALLDSSLTIRGHGRHTGMSLPATGFQECSEVRRETTKSGHRAQGELVGEEDWGLRKGNQLRTGERNPQPRKLGQPGSPRGGCSRQTMKFQISKPLFLEADHSTNGYPGAKTCQALTLAMGNPSSLRPSFHRAYIQAEGKGSAKALRQEEVWPVGGT